VTVEAGNTLRWCATTLHFDHDSSSLSAWANPTGHRSINFIESKEPGTAEEMAEEGPGECDGFAANPYADGDFCAQGYSQ
jgi:hypothetical protein